MAEREGAELQAFVVETMGAIGLQAERALGILRKEVPAAEQQQWQLDARIRISVAVQRGNAEMCRAGVVALNSDADVRGKLMRAVLPHQQVVAAVEAVPPSMRQRAAAAAEAASLTPK